MSHSLVIDTSGLTEGTTVANQAIKVFISKHRDMEIYAVGRGKEMLTINQVKGVHMVDADLDSALDTSKKDNSYILEKAWDVLKKVDSPILITSASKKAVKQGADDHFEKTGLPIFVTRFLSETAKKFTFLADCGIQSQLDPSAYQMVLEEARSLMRKAYGVDEVTYGLLSATPEVDNLPDPLRDVYDSFEGDKADFKGLVTPEELFKNKADLLLSDGLTSEMLIAGYRLSNQSFETYYEKGIARGTKAKWGARLSQDTFNWVNSYYVSDLVSNGRFLLGYDKLILKTEPASMVGSLMEVLEEANRLLKD